MVFSLHCLPARIAHNEGREMPVEDMQCPNCGAPIDFKGGTMATCSFCNSRLTLTNGGVQAASTLNELLANPLNVPGVDVDHIRQLAEQGKKIEAIKLVRQQTDLGLQEAKTAVEALERGESPTFTPRQPLEGGSAYGLDLAPIQDALVQGNKNQAIKLYREQTGVGLREARDAVEAIESGGLPAVTIDQRRNAASASSRRGLSRLGCVLGCLPTLLFVGLCAGFIMLSSQVMFRVWGPLDSVLNILNSSEQVTGAFGRPVSVGPFITGKISGGGSSSHASFGSTLIGPNRTGDLSVSGSWRRGVWDVTIWVIYEDDGEEQTIRITQQIK